MKLKKIAITNYRQFQNAVINFDDELTILAGANNSGKTSIIELFKRIFKDKNFSKEDISAEYYSKLQYDFISCINKIYNITDKETEFRENVKKEFSTENNNKWTAIKIKIEVQYDKNESISLFSDYLMELSDTCTSFFFLFNYEVNITEYLLGDKMQEIYNNYDGSFNTILNKFNQDDDLRINYRCSSNIVGILNNLYNDEKFFQQPNKSSGKVNPTIVITNDFSESFMEQFKDYMQLYLFNRERFEKIGASDLYSALSDMKAYKFPSQYTPVDVLTDTTNDNPDKLFRILFCVCDFIKMVSMAAYGKSIQFAREKKQIFNSGFTNIEFHNDKIIFYDKVQKLEEAYDLSTMTIQGFCEFLTDNEYCNKDIFLPFIEDTEYEKVLKVSLSQLHALYAYLGAPSVSTQHGVKGEGHNNVCFIAEDSTRNPIVYMYEFFQLLCAEDINLTDFQNFYYDYVSEIKSINLTYLKPAKTYKAHEGEYLQYAQYIKNKYKDNKYFLFCQQKYYDKYLGNPNSTNAKDCFKSTKIQGILWAYKLFYVGCSRAKENLVIVIDENKIAPFRKEFIKRMTAIGFDVNGI